MKQENLLKIVTLIIISIVIIIVSYLLIKKLVKLTTYIREFDAKVEMLQIQASGKIVSSEIKAKKANVIFIGTKISEIKDEKMKKIIDEFKQKNIVEEKEFNKYYILTNDDLKKLKLEIKNQKDVYYLINYENNEVLITKSYEGKYKLSNMIKN